MLYNGGMKDEMDILREVGSIAAAHAGAAMSEILGRRITLHLPTIEVVSYNALPSRSGSERIGIAVFSRVIAGLPGEIALVLDEKDAFKLLALSYKIPDQDKNAGIFTEIGLSLMKEVGNIAIGSYVMALSLMLKRHIITSIPTLMNGAVGTMLNSIFAPSKPDKFAFFIEAVFEEPQEKITGGFFLGLSDTAANDIKLTCKKMLSDLEN